MTVEQLTAKSARDVTDKNLITQKAFALLKGVTKQAVSKWKKQGRLAMVGDLVDVEASQKLLTAGATKRSAGRAALVAGALTGDWVAFAADRPSEGGAPTPPPAVATEDADPEVIAERADAFADAVLSGRYVPLADAETIKANALALKHMLDVRAKAGDLISKEAVVAAAFARARQERDQWLNWPGRVAPLVAADLGLEPDRVTELLAAYVHQHLVELGDPEFDFEGRG